VAKSPVAREGLARIGRVFALDEGLRGKPPAEIHRMRNAHMRPLLEDFFAWAEAQYEAVRGERGLLRSALGYAVRQKAALLRPLEDGRLALDNNRSERALRPIAVDVSSCTLSVSVKIVAASRIGGGAPRRRGAAGAPGGVMAW
jgi:hypothetical protein